MTEQPDKTPLQHDIPDAVAEPRRRFSVQLVWIIPIIATIIGASLAIKSFLARGPEITITFRSGEGIEAGKTKLKYKDVQVGEVKNVVIAKDRMHVVVTAEMSKDARGLLVKDTRFWVVRARITGGNVSGLGTLVQGSYIGVAAGKSKEESTEFTGMDTPVVPVDQPGREFVLHAVDIGSLDISSPVYYRRVPVGMVLGYQLDDDGKGVTLRVFIRSPYDRFVKPRTLFWHASGVDLSLDASGLKLNTQSLVTVLLGGVAFDTPDEAPAAPPAAPNSSFILFGTREDAMKRPETVVERYVLVFKESVRGLAIGAPVDLRGVTVGEVAKINLELDPTNKVIYMPVEVRFFPERLRRHYRKASPSTPALTSQELLDGLVAHGFRAQLKTANLLTGQLFVALDFFPKAPPAKINWDKYPPEFPTLSGSLEQLQTKLMHIAEKIEKMPLQEIARDTRKTLQSLDATLKSADKVLKQVDSQVVPEARGALTDVRKTLDEARQTLNGAKQSLSSDAPVQQDLRETLREVARAAQSLRTLADYLERHPESLIRGKPEDER